MIEQVTPDPEQQFLAEHSFANTEDKEQYLEDRKRQISTGATTWVDCRFSTDDDRVFLLFKAWRRVAILEDYGFGTYNVSIFDNNGDLVAVSGVNGLMDGVRVADRMTGHEPNN